MRWFIGVFVGVLLVACRLVGQDDSRQIASHASRAKAAEAQGDFKTAIAEYKALSRLVPANPQLETNLGIALYLDGELPEALAEFKKAINHEPGLFSPHLFAGLSLFRMGEPDMAELQLLSAIKINGTDALPHLWLGYVHLDQAKYNESIIDLKTVLATQPDNPDALYTLGKAYMDLGKLETERLLKEAPDGARVWQLAADQYRARGDRERAVRFYEGALQRRPDLVEVRSALENLRPSQSQEARAGLSRIAGQATLQEDELFSRVRTYEASAREAMDQLGRNSPDSYRAREVLADAFAAEGRDDDAVNAYRSVLEKNKQLPEIHSALGSIFLRQGKAREAAAEFEQELKIQPLSASAHLELARALLVSGDDSRAQQLLAKASRMPRPPSSIYKLLGKLYLRQTKYPQAAAALEQYSRLLPHDGAAHYMLARAYRALGNRSAESRETTLYRKFSIDEKNRTSAESALTRHTYALPESDGPFEDAAQPVSEHRSQRPEPK